jgi:DNA-binding MarR family transcriptional regulator
MLPSSTEPSRRELVQELQFLSERLDALRTRINAISADSSAPITDPLDLSAVGNLAAAREARKQHFNPALFSEGPWDIIVILYLADLEQRRVTASELYSGVGGAPTTCIRWTERLIHEGLVTKSMDPEDGRRIFLHLTNEGLRSMRSYLAAIRGTVPI